MISTTDTTRTPSPQEVTISRHTSLSDDESSDSSLNNDPPSISQIYTDAALYEEVLANSGCPISPPPHSNVSTECNNGFADLVGRDLKGSEQVLACRMAKLSVTGHTWTPSDTDLTAEPESYDDEGDDRDAFVEDRDAQAPVLHRAGTMDGDGWKLEPEEVIRLLIQEFGPLAAEGEEEKLILETDGALLHDVIIVGVIHLTTHRLSFHASLLATRPDLHPSQQVIKSGPAVLIRKGWHSKRRVWMELSHDMFSTYASSSAEDAIRPLRTVLLSSLKEIYPVDPKHPREIHILFDTSVKDMNGIAEFDTEESAQDWRRELQGALFLYRHSRREAFDGGNTDASGVRLSIPLERISNFHSGTNISTTSSVVSLHVQCLADGRQSQVIQIGPIMPVVRWSELGDHIAAAKQRRLSSAIDSTVFVDFGILTFSEDKAAKGLEGEGDRAKAVRAALGLGVEPELWIARARIFRNITSSGYFVVSPHYVSFWSKSFTQDDTRYRLAASNVNSAKSFHVKLLGVHGLALELEGHADLRFGFKSMELRDEAMKRVNDVVEAAHVPHSALLEELSTPTSPSAVAASPIGSPRRSATGIFAPLSRSVAAAVAVGLPVAVQLKLPKAINLPRELLASRPSLHFVCLTIGSRGDVQPYIALGLGLMKEGHRVTIVTHDEYKDWIVGFGIEHRTSGGDPGALMKLSVDNKMFSPDFFKESLTNFRPWLDQLLLDSWEACKDADVLLESPSAMAGVHIAEALNIPYFRTFTMPWTKTAEFPHAFLSPPVDAPTFNSASYVLFANVLWTATSGQINRWRRNTLKIGNTDMGHLAQSKITFIYNFSQAVVPKPLDWGDTTIISGYWFLDNPDLGWTPPKDLLEWMAKARDDKKPIVYIGFGSITVPRPNRVTARIVKAVLKSDVRAIISKGWSARMSKSSENDPEPIIPPECYQLDKVPHDWLFPQIDAALHHGGAGTTGASLRAGIPTLIKPWFGDQFFWASRVQKLGAGLRVPGLRVNDVAEALTKATTSRIMKEKAASIGERIRSEDGVHTAIHTIYTYLPRASRDRASLDKD